MYATPALKIRLEKVLPDACQIMNIGGTPGAAIAVIHHNNLIHTEYIGFRDTESRLPVDEETIFPCASLTKAVVSAAVALCVEDGKFNWDTPVKDILPAFRTKSEILYHNMTPVDCLSHRAGMQNSLYWLGSMNTVLIAKEKSMDFINDLKQVKPFRNEYLYNNLGYEIAAHILEEATGDPWERILHTRIFEVLGMSRTGTRANFDDGENRAKTYETLDDATPIEVVPMLSGDNTVGGPGSAMRSCVRDLVKLYTAFLQADKHQTDNGTSSTPKNPLRQVPFLFSPKISMNRVAHHETSYALGWARVQTPGPMGAIGLNPGLLSPKPAPNVASGHTSTLIYYHQGSMPGNLAAVNLIPDSQGAIIVLTNSLALNDTADWLGQLYLEAYLGVDKRNDYVALAEKTAVAAREWYPTVASELQRHKTPGTSPRNLSEYIGAFYNDACTMMISIFINQAGDLQLSFQGLESEVYNLQHYQDDTFTWLTARNDFVRRGRFTSYNAEYFKISFGSEKKEAPIAFLTWWHDKYLPAPERFSRTSDSL